MIGRMEARWWIVLLSGLEFALPVLGLALAFVRARAGLTRDSALLARARELIHEDEQNGERRAEEILRPTTTWADIPYLREVIADALLHAEWAQFRGPVWLVLGGMAAGLGANLVGVFGG